MHLRKDLVQGSNRKMVIETLNINCKGQNKTWTNQHIKNHKNILELQLIRAQIRQRNPEHMY